jgi:glycosyltransferase involved in cell wall biosynthesis
MNQARVSVIVVVKNGERYVAQALQSIIDQDYAAFEIIVIDGQSTDRTAEIVRSFDRVNYIKQTSHGLANSRNIGLAAASGDLIAFLDHDDVWAPNKLHTQVDFLKLHREIFYTISLVQFFHEKDHPLRPGYKPESFETGQIGCTPGALVARRSVFDAVGGFDPAFEIGCDADWFSRARDAEIAMSLIPEVLLFKRIHETNISANTLTNKNELLALVRQSIERKRQRMTIK